MKLWSSATGQQVLRLKAHTDSVQSLAFTSDGMRLLSGGKDGVVRLWDGTPASEPPMTAREAINAIFKGF
jgi:WD40 repeat protein